jgi:hypothetical protein
MVECKNKPVSARQMYNSMAHFVSQQRADFGMVRTQAQRIFEPFWRLAIFTFVARLFQIILLRDRSCKKKKKKKKKNFRTPSDQRKTKRNALGGGNDSGLKKEECRKRGVV